MKALTTIMFLVTLTSFGQDVNPVTLGVGIVAIDDTYDESKIITVYKDKSFTGKIEDFKLYGQLKRVRPYAYKPDYGLCLFVCLEKTKTYYKILINSTEEGFIKTDKEKHFKTWESLLINSTVERLDIQANPLKVNPGDTEASIKLDYEVKADRLEVLDVIEVNGQHWLKVRFSKFGGMPCAPDCGIGWIKWKAKDQLLVRLLLLC